jgi:uncharacterized protein (UPF0548 family)
MAKRRSARSLRALAQLHGRPLNFDAAKLEELAQSDPWHTDDYCRELPTEPPGPPIPGDSFEIAKRLMTDYEFADPKVVRAYYEADHPLLGRDMLLEIRFWGIRVRVGVRVAKIFDGERTVDGRQVQIWGWAYRTLEGHLERGQMDYQLWKWLDTGAVEYRIHAISEIADAGNPIVRLGFRLFGRREQVKFARECGERMVRLTSAAVNGTAGKGELEPEVADGIAVSPTRADDA